MTIESIHTIFLRHPIIYTDSRKINGPGIFFALKGDRFDGNLYAKQAVDSGAIIAIVDDITLDHDDRFVYVNDGLETLQRLASYHRSLFDIPVIGLTGSNGKTTTKELLYAALSQSYNVLYTHGNFNNHIGVPLTLLRIKKEHQIAIIEMGASAMREIEFLSNLARPTEGFITNIGIAHVEGFGSEENILKGKTELYEYLKQCAGLIYINRADENLISALADYDHYFSYAIGDLAHTSPNNVTVKSSYVEKVKLLVQEVDRDAVLEIQSNLTGDYNAANVAVAVAVAVNHKVSLSDIKRGIESYIPDNNRSQVVEFKGKSILLDAYNANPTSMSAAIKSFSTRSGKNGAILGSMKELGKESLRYHEQLIREVGDALFEQVVFIGAEFPENSIGPVYKSLEELNQEKLWDLFSDTESILIKGSRSWKLEKLVKL